MTPEVECYDAEDEDVEPITECEGCGGYMPPWQQTFLCDTCQYDQEI